MAWELNLDRIEVNSDSLKSAKYELIKNSSQTPDIGLIAKRLDVSYFWSRIGIYLPFYIGF